MREECCHFGTSGWVFTLWVEYFRASNKRHPIWWVPLSLLAEGNCFCHLCTVSTVQVSANQLWLLWLRCDFQRYCSGILQTGWYLVCSSRFCCSARWTSERERGLGRRTTRRGFRSSQTERSGIICRSKMAAVVFGLCATGVRGITQFLMASLAEAHWWDCFNARGGIASPQSPMRGESSFRGCWLQPPLGRRNIPFSDRRVKDV